MAVKFLVIAALVSCVRGSIIPLHAAPLTELRSDHDANAQYAYAYDVADYSTGDIKNQYETRNGDVVKGEYSLIDPDGTKRTVTYNADINGFNAVVKKEPLPQFANPIVKAELVSSPLSPGHPVPALVAEPQTAEVVASSNLVPTTVVHTPVPAPVSVISPSHIVAEHVLQHEVIPSSHIVQHEVIPSSHVVQHGVIPSSHVVQHEVIPSSHVVQHEVIPSSHVVQQQVIPATHVVQEQVLQHQVVPATQVVQQQVIPAPAQYIQTPQHYQIVNPQRTFALNSPYANYHDQNELSYHPYHGSIVKNVEYSGPVSYEAPYLTTYVNKPERISYAHTDSYNARLASKSPAPLTYAGPLGYTYSYGLPQHQAPLYSARYTSPYVQW